ncbi:MAG: hypothetical protein HOI95_00900 [Chromatiales bacterium]|jgi:type IV pilus assembly protein PilY1|nr:hypothetical protein [Chromatiales bacterium]
MFMIYRQLIKRLWPALGCVIMCTVVVMPMVHADDTDVYLNPSVPTGSEPLVIFTLDYLSNLGSSACAGTECDSLINAGYMAAAGPYTFFDVLRGALKKVLDPLDGIKIGFMINHADTCTGNNTSGPSATKCSNGGYVLSGLKTMDAGTDDPLTYQFTGEDPDKVALYAKLDALPTPGGTLNHSFQGKELYFEMFRYLTGQGVYNGHVGFKDYGDTDGDTNLDVYRPAVSWDTAIESGANYISPLTGGACTKTFAINFMFQVSNQEDDSDDAIESSRASGGMGGINLSGNKNKFDTVIQYLNDADLGDGSYGTVGVLDGEQNVVSYFLVDPSKINVKTSGYATAGGTGSPLPFSDNPDELVAAISNIFKSILSVSTTFVAPSVPVNVFNRAQIVDEVFLALFEADENGLPLWNGNLKKLQIGDNVNGDKELQDVNGTSAIDIDGRVRRDALTLWSNSATLPTPSDDEVANKDGRAVARGGAGQQIPGYDSGSPALSNSTSGARQLFTENPGNGSDNLMALNADATTAAALWTEITQNWSPAASNTTYAAASSAEKTKAVNILKFARGLQDDGATRRPWFMGDPLHSRPRPVNYGAQTGFSITNPDIRILMGTNGGFMHMFQNTNSAGVETGTENWAFIPRAVIPLLDRLRTNTGAVPIHPIGVDGSPVTYVEDNDLDGTIESSDSDRVIVMFGLRRGGKAYYALDITDPDAPKFKWKIEKGGAGTAYEQLAQSWSTPNLGRLKVGGVEKAAFVIGGGYNGDDGGDNLGDLGKDAKNRATLAGTTPAVGVNDDEGNALFIGDLDTGSLIWKAIKGDSSYVFGTTTYSHPDMSDSFADALVAIDARGDGFFDRIYAGDTGGVLWRIDLAGFKDHDGNGATPDILVLDDPSVWQATRVMSVGRHASLSGVLADDRRFFNAPDVAQSRDTVGPFDGVLIGSGDREDPNGSDVRNSFYLLKDRAVKSGIPPSSMVVEANLADLTSNCLQTNSCGTPPDLTSGWRLDLASIGEKNLAPSLTAGGTVFFTTFEPATASGTCSLSEGTGRVYAVSIQDATAVFNYDVTNDTPNAPTLERVDVLGSGGIPVQVVPLGEGLVLIQGQEVGENIVKSGGRTGFKTYWYESYK